MSDDGESGVGGAPGLETIWTADEVNSLIEAWSRNADEVNLARNEPIMEKIAERIGTAKTAKQVRTKLKKMRSQYVLERQKVEDSNGRSKWRYYNMLNLFGHKIYKNPNRRLGGKPSDLPNRLAARSSRAQMINLRESKEAATVSQVAALLAPLNRNNNIAELPPIYPFDPEVPIDVVIDAEWIAWNGSLQYAMTDSGIRTLLRSGFRDVTHLELLKRNNASISYLHLNYHDKLALEHALDNGGLKLQQYQVITNDDGTVLEVRGCADADETLLLSDKGVKMNEWNRTLPQPLTDAGLVKVIKAGFTVPEDVTTLVGEEAVEDLDLTIRDKAALRKIVGL